MKREIVINIVPRPEELAQCFCDFDASEQAQFFNHVYEISKTWKAPFCFQLQQITESPELLPSGREIMSQIGEYSSPEVA